MGKDDAFHYYDYEDNHGDDDNYSDFEDASVWRELLGWGQG